MSKILTSIQKLWKGKLSPKEAAELNELLRNGDTELRKELESSFNKTLSQELNSEEQRQASEIFNKLLAKINKTGERKAKVISIMRLSMTRAAAVIILGFTAVQIYHIPKKHFHAEGSSISRHIKEMTSLKSITNNTKDKMAITLEDSSIVTLFSHSTISYREGFDENTRNISLEGMAYFKVAKDVNKPFIVLSGGFTTTALGTAFSVDTRQTGKAEIKLYEGKVVVRSVNTDHLKKDVYLAPMQSFTANISARKFVVGAFNTRKNLPAIRKNNNRFVVLANEELDFYNEPLDIVFDKLNEKFHANIRYSRDQLKGLHFTGTVFKTDSLKTIITIISRMNGLTFEQQGTQVIVHGKQ